MSPNLLRAAFRSTRYTRHLASGDRYARWPRDYWRAADRHMLGWLRMEVR